MSRRRRRDAQAHENHERWLITYADMITLLMAFFIMMYSMSVVDLKKFEALSESARGAFGGKSGGPAPTVGSGGRGLLEAGNGLLAGNRASLVNEVNGALNATLPPRLRSRVVVTHSGGCVRISMRADTIMFPVGEAELTDEARQILDLIGPALQASEALLVVEGHTCDLPIGTARYPSNWELSAQRATNVMVHLIRRCRIEPELICAVGYADRHPIAPNASETQRKRNRRVDIVVLGADLLSSDAGHSGRAGSEDERAEGVRLGPVRLAPPIDLRARYYQHTGRRSVDGPAER